MVEDSRWGRAVRGVGQSGWGGGGGGSQWGRAVVEKNICWGWEYFLPTPLYTDCPTPPSTVLPHH